MGFDRDDVILPWQKGPLIYQRPEVLWYNALSSKFDKGSEHEQARYYRNGCLLCGQPMRFYEALLRQSPRSCGENHEKRRLLEKNAHAGTIRRAAT
jgi:hypothetical protein